MLEYCCASCKAKGNQVIFKTGSQLVSALRLQCIADENFFKMAAKFADYMVRFSIDSQSNPVKGTGSRLSACSLIKLLISNLLLIVSVNNPTHMYLSDIRVYFKVEVYFRVT